MTIEVSAGFLRVRFVSDDWTNQRGGAKAVIDGIKSKIGHIDYNPHGFIYNDEEKLWYIHDTEQNKKTLEELKKQFIDDPNQETLF